MLIQGTTLIVLLLAAWGMVFALLVAAALRAGVIRSGGGVISNARLLLFSSFLAAIPVGGMAALLPHSINVALIRDGHVRDVTLFGKIEYNYANGFKSPITATQGLKLHEILVINDSELTIEVKTVCYLMASRSEHSLQLGCPTKKTFPKIPPFSSSVVPLDQKIQYFGPNDRPPQSIETKTFGWHEHAFVYWLTW